MKTTILLLAVSVPALAGELSTTVASSTVTEDGTLVVQNTTASVPVGEAGPGTVFLVPEMTVPGQQEIRVHVVNTPAPPEEPALNALLVVQNHVQNREYRDNLLGLADALAAAFSDHGVTCTLAENMLGTNQNRGQGGEDLTGSSAVGQSQALGTDYLITVSVTSVSVNRGGTAQLPTYAPQIKMTVNAVNNKTGATVAGQNVTAGLPVAWGDGSDDVWYPELMEAAANACAERLAEKLKGRSPTSEARLAEVTFTCDVAGADVKVDGFAYGTAPLKLRLPAGVHEVAVSYPFCVPYKARANVQDGQVYNLRLQLTAEGAARYKDMTLFAETVDRIRKAGATDDYVRRVLADGQGAFLKESHFKWDGAAQTLTIERPGAAPVTYGPTTIVH